MTSCRVAAQTRLTLINRGTAYHKFIVAKSKKVGNMMGNALEMGGWKLDEDVFFTVLSSLPGECASLVGERVPAGPRRHRK